MMEGGLDDSIVEATLLSLSSTPISGATPKTGEANLWDTLEALVITIACDNPYDLVKTSVKDSQGIAETNFGQVEDFGGANITSRANEASDEEEPIDERPLTRSRARHGIQDVNDGVAVACTAESTQGKAKVINSFLHSGIQNPTSIE